MCSLYNSCRTANPSDVFEFSRVWIPVILVVFLQHSEFARMAFQDDWIASRMKNRAKMHLHLFPQTNESSRNITQYRCYFRRDISYVVGDSSARSTTSSPPPPFIFDSHIFRLFSRWSTRSVLSLSSTQYSSLLVQNVFFQFTKFVHFPLFMLWRNCVFWISFLNMCSLYNLCRIALLGCVLGLVFSGLHVRLCAVFVVLLCGEEKI